MHLSCHLWKKICTCLLGQIYSEHFTQIVADRHRKNGKTESDCLCQDTLLLDNRLVWRCVWSILAEIWPFNVDSEQKHENWHIFKIKSNEWMEILMEFTTLLFLGTTLDCL